MDPTSSTSIDRAAGFAGLPARAPDTGQAQRDFAAVLSGKGVEKSSPRQTAEDLVAISLVQPILAQLRESNQTAAPFAPSSGEKQFRTIADAQLARQIVRGGNFNVVSAIERKLKAASAGADHAAPSAGTFSPLKKKVTP